MSDVINVLLCAGSLKLKQLAKFAKFSIAVFCSIVAVDK